MKNGHLRQDPGSRGSEPDKNLPSILDSLLAADEAKFFQFVHQTDGRVMFYLQPLAEISNGEPIALGEGFDGVDGFGPGTGTARVSGRSTSGPPGLLMPMTVICEGIFSMICPRPNAKIFEEAPD